jgi:hypothetical protein
MTEILNYLYDLDVTGVAPSNRIRDEQHTITGYVAGEYRFIVPRNAPFYTMNYDVYLIDPATGNKVKLERFAHYAESHPYREVTNALKKQVCGSIMILDRELIGTLSIEYNTIGGPFCIDSAKVLEILANKLINPIDVDWSRVVDVPAKLPPEIHYHPTHNLGGFDELVTAVKNNTTALINETDVNSKVLTKHILDVNPHGINLKTLGVEYLHDTYFASDKDIEEAYKEKAVINARGLGTLKRQLQEMINNINHNGSGNVDNEKVAELERQLHAFMTDLEIVKRYGIATKEEDLNKNANNLYATIQHVFRIIEKHQASLEEVFEGKLVDRVVSPNVLKRTLDELIPIGSMLYLPRSALASNSYVIPNGAKFNRREFPRLFEYLGTDTLPNVGNRFIRCYSPGVVAPSAIGAWFDGTDVVADVWGSANVDIPNDNLAPHYHITEYRSNVGYDGKVPKGTSMPGTENDGSFMRSFGMRGAPKELDAEDSRPIGDRIRRVDYDNNSLRLNEHDLKRYVDIKHAENEMVSNLVNIAKVTSLPFLNKRGNEYDIVDGEAGGSGTTNRPVNLTINKRFVKAVPDYVYLNLVMRAR